VVLERRSDHVKLVIEAPDDCEDARAVVNEA
jgi:hypothetical protein